MKSDGLQAELGHRIAELRAKLARKKRAAAA